MFFVLFVSNHLPSGTKFVIIKLPNKNKEIKKWQNQSL